MEKKLEVKDLQISFRTQGGTVKAVRDISFDLYKGETLAIVGESGSGKSVTSKAIIGILAGNSIVEGGEILYDGQDLLKISEEDFHEIRGNKISMIFQDPMSSLNPIIRVGKQLTEAMILNGKARQKNARDDFNSRLKLLNKKINEVNPNHEQNTLKCRTFDAFCIESTKIEQKYNDANAEATALKTSIENLVFLISKNQKIDLAKELKEIIKILPKTYHHFVVNELEMEPLKMMLIDSVKTKKYDNVVETLNQIIAQLTAGLKKKAPNFFRLGYYKYKNPNFDESSMPVKELDEMTVKYLDDNFMLDFIDLGASGIKHCFEQSIEKKKRLINDIHFAIDYFKGPEIDKSAFKIAKDLSIKVADSIDRLLIVKRNVEYSFSANIKHQLKVYFSGIKNNPKMLKKHQRQMDKFQKLVDAGKKPTWQVTPPVLVDLELTKNNIVKLLNELEESYKHDISKKYDEKKEMIKLVDYMKSLASSVVYKVTKRLAKAKALELLEEVGIPEPAIRFKQYPFEFSGGMRQRIVIAIALSANPDILICDEPTTALDVTIQSQILELINKIKKERNLSVIFITHDLGVVANMADRIAVMYAGKIVEYGTSEDIFYDPRHPYTWALLSSMPDLDTKEKLESIPGTPPNMIYPPKGDAFAERNKYALEIDYEMQPPMFEVSKTHYAATWLLHPNAPKVELPKVIADRIKRMKEANKNGK